MKNKKRTDATKDQTPPQIPVFINPFSDFGFKRFFANKENKELAIDFINALLEGETIIHDITLASVERAGATKDTRKVVFDAEGESDNNIFVIMEMQKMRQVFIKSRSVYYAAANLHEQLAPGNKDFQLKELVFICLTDFIFDVDHPDQVVQTIKLTTQENSTIFYNKLTFKYIELPKFKRQEDELVTRLDFWLFALTGMRKQQEIPLSLRGDKIFEKLYRIARLSDLNKSQMNAYQRAEMDRMDWVRGLNVARMEGEEIGEQRGEKSKQLSIARSLKAMRIATDIIEKSTGLNVKEIAEL